MRTQARDPRRRDVFDQLAARVREVAREEHLNAGSGVERFRVTATAPLKIEQLGGELTLEAGDPDFSIGKALSTLTLHVGDLLWVAHSGSQEFHAFDLVN